MDHPVSTARKAKKMSQSDLARACGLSRSTICKIEKYQRGSLTTFRSIGRALDVDWRDLIPEEVN